MKRFVYFYLMRDAPADIRRVVPAHVQYWKALNLPGYVGGPFADHTGGLITFEAAGFDDIQQAVMGDPFVHEELLEQQWIKAWVIE